MSKEKFRDRLGRRSREEKALQVLLRQENRNDRRERDRQAEELLMRTRQLADVTYLSSIL